MTANYGPQHEQVVALLERARALTPGEIDADYAAWQAAWDAARDAAWAVGRDAAWDAAWAAAWDAAWAAALALIVRDLITPDQYRILVQPWASVCGWPHPDDAARYGGGVTA